MGAPVEAPRLGEEHRPWCCPEPRCIPVHTVQGAQTPLSLASPGESFVCFGDAPVVRFEYDGVQHLNDTRSCHYTPLKGLLAYQENAEDWQAMQSAYWRATEALKARRGGSLDLLVNERTNAAAASPGATTGGDEVMGERVLMCACGCGKTLDEAKREARANPGWLNADQAEADVAGVWVDTPEPAQVTADQGGESDG